MPLTTPGGIWVREPEARGELGHAIWTRCDAEGESWDIGLSIARVGIGRSVVALIAALGTTGVSAAATPSTCITVVPATLTGWAIPGIKVATAIVVTGGLRPVVTAAVRLHTAAYRLGRDPGADLDIRFLNHQACFDWFATTTTVLGT